MLFIRLIYQVRMSEEDRRAVVDASESFVLFFQFFQVIPENKVNKENDKIKIIDGRNIPSASGYIDSWMPF